MLDTQKLEDLEYRIKQLEALVLALIEKLDAQDNRTSSVKVEYRNKAKTKPTTKPTSKKGEVIQHLFPLSLPRFRRKSRNRWR